MDRVGRDIKDRESPPYLMQGHYLPHLILDQGPLQSDLEHL